MKCVLGLLVVIAACREAAKREPPPKTLYTKACSLGSREGCLNAGVDPDKAPLQIVPRT